jgi:hypothetical protein
MKISSLFLLFVSSISAFSTEFEVNDIPVEDSSVSIGPKDSLRIRTRLGLDQPPIVAILSLVSSSQSDEKYSLLLIRERKFHNIVLTGDSLTPGTYALHVCHAFYLIMRSTQTLLTRNGRLLKL